MKHKNNIVSVFGSSRPKQGDPEYLLAYDMGKGLAKAGYTVCNGGYGGIMEATARGAKDSGGQTIGIVTEVFSAKANSYIDRPIITKTLNERLLKLVELGDAYVVLRGGTGTLLELSTAWEYINKKIIEERPIVVVGEFWSPIIETMNNQLESEAPRKAVRHVTLVASANECVEVLNRKLGGR